MVYVAFAIDAYSRRILGWRAANTMKTPLVLDALVQALWMKQAAGRRGRRGRAHPPHRRGHAQYTSIAFTERLAAAGVQRLGRQRRRRLRQRAGRVGDRACIKTELIKPRGPWRTAGQVEIATLDYVDWFNHRRLYEACGDIPPAELETAYYRQNSGLAEAG